MSEAAPGPAPGDPDRVARPESAKGVGNRPSTPFADSGRATPARKRPSGEFLRWQAFFQRCDEPLFFLNRRRRVLFVNRAWEALTGLSAAEAHNLVCSRVKPANPGEPPNLYLMDIATCGVEQEALSTPEHVRRLLELRPDVAKVMFHRTDLPRRAVPREKVTDRMLARLFR